MFNTPVIKKESASCLGNNGPRELLGPKSAMNTTDVGRVQRMAQKTSPASTIQQPNGPRVGIPVSRNHFLVAGCSIRRQTPHPVIRTGLQIPQQHVGRLTMHVLRASSRNCVVRLQEQAEGFHPQREGPPLRYLFFFVRVFSGLASLAVSVCSWSRFFFPRLFCPPPFF
jgi:hypothetical protein